MSELPYYCFAKDTWKPTGRFHVFHGLLVLVLQGTASLLPCESPPTSWLTCAATAHAVLKKPVRDREGEPENDLLFRDSPLLGKRTKITLSGIIHFGKIEVALNIAPKLSKTRPLFFWAKGKETWDPGCVLVTREPPLTTGSSTIWQEVWLAGESPQLCQRGDVRVPPLRENPKKNLVPSTICLKGNRRFSSVESVIMVV